MTTPSRIYVISSVWADGRLTPFIATHTMDDADRYIREHGWAENDPRKPQGHLGYDTAGVALLSPSTEG